MTARRTCAEAAQALRTEWGGPVIRRERPVMAGRMLALASALAAASSTMRTTPDGHPVDVGDTLLTDVARVVLEQSLLTAGDEGELPDPRITP